MHLLHGICLSHLSPQVRSLGGNCNTNGCVLDFGPPTFSAGVVYRRALLARHSRVVYKLQGNNRNSSGLKWLIIRSQDSWVKGWIVYRRFVEHRPKQIGNAGEPDIEQSSVSQSV